MKKKVVVEIDICNNSNKYCSYLCPFFLDNGDNEHSQYWCNLFKEELQINLAIVRSLKCRRGEVK